MCCCCCIENSYCCDFYCGGLLTGDLPGQTCGVLPLSVGSPVCACTDWLDQALQNLQGDSLPTDTGDVACYQPLTSGTTDNPIDALGVGALATNTGDVQGYTASGDPVPGNPSKAGPGSAGIGSGSGGSSGSGSAGGKCNKPTSGQCTSALSNAVNTLGSLLKNLINKPTGSTANSAGTAGTGATPTTIGMIVIVVLLGGLLIAMAFGSKA